MSTMRCAISGSSFTTGTRERELCRKLGAPAPRVHPTLRIRQLLAFWPQLALHRIKCRGTGRSIIGVFDEQCPYPVWHREHWFSNAAPPAADYDFSEPFFPQLWRLFQRCPIPHNIGLGTENCEYTDDWWYSRNCYLCHSGIHSEDCCYCYRIIRCRDCQYCVFTFDCELCRDLVNCANCHSLFSSVSCRNCRDSAFLFDCRNCEHCLLCWNLRNSRYCIENVQYTKDEFEKRRARLDLASLQVYEQARALFRERAHTKALWRALSNENAEDSSGAFLTNVKNCENCYFMQEAEDCANCFRGYEFRDALDVISGFKSELLYNCALPQVDCYSLHNCFNVSQSKYLEYCAYCHDCRRCFGCCGLVGREYHILNRPFTPESYQQTVPRIQAALAAQGLAGAFFPGYFAPNPYEESLAALHFPLPPAEQERLGFNVLREPAARPPASLPVVPDRADQAGDDICGAAFWDEQAQKPFRITEHDLAFARRSRVPLPHQYYSRRMKELFSWMHCGAALRETACALTGAPILTCLPADLDGRIVSEEAYMQKLCG